MSYNQPSDFANLAKTIEDEISEFKKEAFAAAGHLDEDLRIDLAKFVGELGSLVTQAQSIPKKFKPLAKRLRDAYKEADKAAGVAVKKLPKK